MGGKRPGGYFGNNLSLLNAIEILVHLMLQTQCATHFLGVELRGCQVIHHLPVASAMDQIAEAVSHNITNVKFFVTIVKKHAAWRNQPRA